MGVCDRRNITTLMKYSGLSFFVFLQAQPSQDQSWPTHGFKGDLLLHSDERNEDEVNNVSASKCSTTPAAAETTTTTNGTNGCREGPRRISNGRFDELSDDQMSINAGASKGKLSPFLDTSPPRNSSLELKGEFDNKPSS